MRWTPFAAAFLLSALSCKNSSEPSGASKLTLRGKISAPAVAPGVARAGEASGATLAQASQVVVIYVSGPPQISPITSGAFEIGVNRKPAGLIFADADGHPVGYLSLGNGIASLPLNVASDTLTLIDFQTLVANGVIITPAHDPLGAELPMSPADIAVLAQTNAYFAETVKNSDADGDGLVDALSGRYYVLNLKFGFWGGTFDSGSTSRTMDLPLVLNCLKLNLWAFDPNPPSAVTIRFPDGSVRSGGG